MEKVKIDYPLNVDYVELFGQDWTELLAQFFGSNYMYNLMIWINEMYKLPPGHFRLKNQGQIFPLKERLFENFRVTSPKNTRVIIIGHEPYPSKTATGVPFANPKNDNGALTRSLINIETCIRNSIYNGSEDYKIDETLNKWMAQGVFLLDASSTCNEYDIDEHMIYWKNFNRTIIKILNQKFNNIIFLLWGENAHIFEKYINLNTHYVLKSSLPVKNWNCNHFNRVNEIITTLDGKNKKIIW